MSDQNDKEDELDPPKHEETVSEATEASEETVDAAESEESDIAAESEPEAAQQTRDSHGDDDHGSDHAHHSGLSHVASSGVLLGTFGALMVLTGLTVGAILVDLGSSLNLVIAMVIATIKAGLVCMFFMHLRYDKAMHTVAFLSALLFALLFVSFALMDSSEYQQDIVWVEEAQ